MKGLVNPKLAGKLGLNANTISENAFDSWNTNNTKNEKIEIVKRGMENGLQFVPLPANTKAIFTPGWSNTYYNVTDFQDDGNIGVNLKLSRDLVCFDIDCKKSKGFSVEQINEIHSIAKSIKNPKIYVETSVSGEGIHLFTKLNNELKSAVYGYFPCTKKTQLAQNLEYFTTNKQVCTYPSAVDGKKCIPYNSKIYNVDYLDYEEFEELMAILVMIANIMGLFNDGGASNTNTKKSNTSHNYNINTTIMDIEDIPQEIKEKLQKINYKYFRIPEKGNTNSKILRYELVKKILDALNIEYVEKDDWKLNIYSCIEDDGQNPDAYIFCNRKYPIYFDFHLNAATNWLEALYTKYGEHLFNVLYEILNITANKPKKPVIYAYSRDDIEYHLENNIDKKVLVIAPTGFGKTSTVKNIAKKRKICMIEPLAVQVAQEFSGKSKNTICLWEEAPTRDKNADYSKFNLIFTTSAQIKEKYEKYEKLEHIMVIDEAHTLAGDMGYRGQTIQAVWKLLENRRNWVMMTATPRFCGLEEGCDLIIKANVGQKPRRYVRKCHISGNNITYFDAICTQICQSDKKYGDKVFHIVYIDSEKQLHQYQEALEKRLPNKSIKIVTSEEVKKNPEIVNDIVKRRKIESNILLCTRKLSMGFHIEQNGVFEFHILNGDINIIEQLINRIRHFDHNGKPLQNQVICTLYSKKDDWKYVDYAAKFELYFQNLKEFANKIEFAPNARVYTDFMKQIKYGNENTLRGMVYETLVAESKYNIEYIYQEIVKSGWKAVENITVTSASKIQINQSTTDKLTIMNELLEELEIQILECPGWKVVQQMLEKYENDKTRKQLCFLLKDVVNLDKLDEFRDIVQNAARYDEIAKKVNEWRVLNDTDGEISNIKNVILEYVNGKDKIPVKELKSRVGNVKRATTLIKKIMEDLGYTAKPVRCGGKLIRCWVKDE